MSEGRPLIRDRYEPLEVAGRGGQGEVVLALDPVHDRRVAIKLRDLGSEHERDTLLQEARKLAASRGEFKRGATLLAAAETLRGTMGTVLRPVEQRRHDRDVISLRYQLDQASLASAWNAGRVTSREDALALALEHPS